jgi:hypothetical protein
MPDPAFRSISSTTYATRTNTTVTAPSGITNGDLLIFGIGIFGSGGEAVDPTPPAGFSLISGPSWPLQAVEGANEVETRIYSKVASGESGDYTATHADASSQGWMVAVSDPSVNFVITGQSGTGTTTTALSVTSANNNALILFIVHDWLSNAADISVPTGTTPTFTERLDGATSLFYVATGVLGTAGATGDKTITNRNNIGDPWSAVLLAIEPFVPVVPLAPTITFQAGGHERAGVQWTAGSDGGSAITDWDIDAAPASAPTSWIGVQATSSTLLYGAYTGLTNGTAYVFRVRGVNAVGDGAWSSTSGSATPSDVRGSFLLENGDKFLLENGDEFLLEAGAAAAAAGPGFRHRPQQLLYR